MTDPYPRTAQFMLSTVGFGAIGKKVNTHTKTRKATEMTLMGKPSLPRSNLDGSKGCPRILLSMMHEMDIKYDVNMAATPREMTCMNATVDPRLMSDKRTTKKSVIYTELTGISSFGET